MLNRSRARIAGIIGMAGAVLWIVDEIARRNLGAEASSNSLYTLFELLAFFALPAVNIGFVGLIWGGAFRGRFGTFAVVTHVTAYALIVLGGILTLLLNSTASMHFILFPIGGALEGVAQMLLIVAVLADARWSGWQRWIPLCYGVFQILAVGLPLVLGVTPDGPDFSVQIGTGVWWLLVGLAVYTASTQAVTAKAPAAVSQT